MLDRGVVLLADRLYCKEKDFDLNSNKLEQISDDYFSDIFNALRNIAPRIVHYNSPAELIDNAHKHKKDIVFTVYGGHSSRNRLALVPAICEAYGIKYVGADAYNRIICQDKNVSKELAKRKGLKVPNAILGSCLEDFAAIESLIFPVVVKPLMEGSSIGISKKSLCSNIHEATLLALDVLNKYQQPVLVEEFISGHEIVVCCIGNSKEIKLCEAVEVYNPQDENYFHHCLYTNDIKHSNTVETKHRIITEKLPEFTMRRLEAIFTSFGKMDFMRIDGRVYKNDFIFIEFTPDAYIGGHSSFADVYRAKGLTYERVLQDIIETASIDSQIQFPIQR